MKSKLVTALILIFVAACGSPEQSTETEPANEAASSPAEAPAAPVEEVAESSGNPCVALEAKPVRYDAAGKPVVYTFEYPSGWKINELFTSGATSIDVTKSVENERFPEFVLRFGHVVDKQMDHPENLVATWRKMPMTEDISEIDIEGRTMYVSRTKMGEMVGFQALFPDVTSDSKAWLVSGGVTNAPKECRDEAIDAVERIIRSFKPNPDIGPPPSQ